MGLFLFYLYLEQGLSVCCRCDLFAVGFPPELWELKDLLQEADEKKFPESELKSTLANAISEAEKCANVANQLVSKKVRTRYAVL